MELRRATRDEIAGLRAAKQAESDLSIVPGFYRGLADEAEPFLIVEAPATSTSAGAAAASVGPPPAAQTLGYALLLGRDHDGHVHTTLIEVGLGEGHRDRFEDVLDLIRDQAKPTAYLVRTDDCRLNATLLSRGLQVEASALVLLPEESRPAPAVADAAAGAPDATGATPPPAAAAASGPPPRLELVPLTKAHIAGIGELLPPDIPEAVEPAGHHHGGPTADETMEQVRDLADSGHGWVLFADESPQAVVAQMAAEEGDYELLDFIVAQGEEAWLAWGLSAATRSVQAAGRRPAAVIDALDSVRRRILRAAGYYTAAAYMVFYDPMAGRPSVPTVSLPELQAMIARRDKFHLVDVMGEEHWKAGHLPRSEWIDFRGLGREARRRYKQDDTIVVYCNGFT